MNILLISANRVRVPYLIYPIGIDYVAGAIGDRHSVETLDMNIVADPLEFRRIVESFGPDVVGVSIRNIDSTDQVNQRDFFSYYSQLASMIRDCTNASIVLGGSGFTLFPHTMMDIFKADYGMIGEGERFPLLLDAIEKNDSCMIPGVVCPGVAPQPPPPWDGPVHRQSAGRPDVRDFYIQNGGMLNIQSKRGCPYRCIYCTYPRIEGSNIRYTPADEVAETAYELQRAGARYLYFSDSVFNNCYEHSASVAEAFIRKGITVPWGGFFSPTLPPAGYYGLLARSGLTHVEFGTETMCDRTLESYRKPFSVDNVFESHEAALAAGLHVAHYMLLGGPGETEKTLSETLMRTETLRRSVIFFFCGMRIYPGTALRETAIEEGQISDRDELVSPTYYQSGGTDGASLQKAIQDVARGREDWVIGSGGSVMARLIARLHKKGISGPLWEFLIK